MTDRRDVEQFRDAIARCWGLQFDETRSEFLRETLEARLLRLGVGADAYLRDLTNGAARTEAAALAPILTVGETYFFRNSEQFSALAEVVVPDRMRHNAPRRTLRALSAGCASGEEAYSIAIQLREAVPDGSWDVTVRAVDLNPAALERACRGRYTAWSLRGTPAEVRRRWFYADGRDFVLADAARKGVVFETANLACDDDGWWSSETFDVVFCRNVMMYFAPEVARALVARIARALRPGGYLFLGHAEILRGLSDAFHLCHTHGTFYYRRKGDGEFAAAPGAVAGTATPTASAIPDAVDNWVEVIRAASDRVASLALPSQPESKPQLDAPAWDLSAPYEMLREERFAEALACVRGLPPAAAGNAAVLLLTATLLAHSGQTKAAEETCRALLGIDELSAGAHYVLALCREAAGDRDGAAEHDRIAAYLDASFAMPRLHLGLLAQRTGDHDKARRELGHARLLLQREDEFRLLLFGGGFNRDSLIALCDSALRTRGAAA